MRFLTLVSLFAIGSLASAADHTSMNKMCPVDGKLVDSSVKMLPYNSKTDQAAKASSGATQPSTQQMIGFCGAKCHEMYEKDPAKYHDAIEKERHTTK